MTWMTSSAANRRNWPRSFEWPGVSGPKISHVFHSKPNESIKSEPPSNMRLAPHELRYIETLAIEQLEEYYSIRPDDPRVPTPIENLLELHLGLGLLYMDLKTTLENELILGALNVPGKEVWIDHSLDP